AFDTTAGTYLRHTGRCPLPRPPPARSRARARAARRRSAASPESAHLAAEALVEPLDHARLPEMMRSRDRALSVVAALSGISDRHSFSVERSTDGLVAAANAPCDLLHVAQLLVQEHDLSTESRVERVAASRVHARVPEAQAHRFLTDAQPLTH